MAISHTNIPTSLLLQNQRHHSSMLIPILLEKQPPQGQTTSNPPEWSLIELNGSLHTAGGNTTLNQTTLGELSFTAQVSGSEVMTIGIVV